MAEESIPIGRLRWRCRRGTKELDRILGAYLDQDYANALPEHQHAFVALLEVQDPDIYDWLMGAKEPEEKGFKSIIQILQQKFQILK